jgi:hypothetical protein
VKREELIKGFAQLGNLMFALGKNEPWKDYSIGLTEEEYADLNTLIVRQKQFNGWFTEDNVRQALKALGEQLNESGLTIWLKDYSFADHPKNVALVMAGNIPLVGFHDFLCVLLSGHSVICKLSSDDKTLLPALSKHLVNFVPGLESRITFSLGKMQGFDAVIATGSNNSTRYFEQYFGKYPHIFRSNRTSVAIVYGDESKEELEFLGNDIFQYFGLGCRNVSHLLIKSDADINKVFEGLLSHSDVIDHHKYANNYDYNRAVFLLNKVPFLDNNFVLMRESEELFSPLAVIHYQRFIDEDEVNNFIERHVDQLQVIAGKGRIPFGQAQCPMLNDYADGVDTMRFLNSL